MKSNLIKRIFFFILFLILIYNLFYIGRYLLESYNNRKLYTQIKSNYKTEIDSPTKNMDTLIEEENLGDRINNGKDKEYLDKFESLLKINNEVVGWINIENTNIDYPVVKGQDNEFYLDHDINKEKSMAGSIFMDFRNKGDHTDKNTILYGHHMKDGSMFKDLMGYKDLSFLKDNPIISFSSLYEINKWEIFSVYITDIDFDYIKTYYSNDEEYENFLKEIKDKSLFETEIIPTKEDRILTLSTCTYEFNNGRFVIHGRKVN